MVSWWRTRILKIVSKFLRERDGSRPSSRLPIPVAANILSLTPDVKSFYCICSYCSLVSLMFNINLEIRTFKWASDGLSFAILRNNFLSTTTGTINEVGNRVSRYAVANNVRVTFVRPWQSPNLISCHFIPSRQSLFTATWTVTTNWVSGRNTHRFRAVLLSRIWKPNGETR